MKLFRKSGRTRWAMAGMAAALGIAATALITPGVASAHHADVTASVNCNARVSFSVTSWDPGNLDGTLTNTGEFQGFIAIKYRIDGSDTSTGLTGRLDAGNNWTFNGSFNWPTGATSIQVVADAEGFWASGQETYSVDTSAPIFLPTDCAPIPGASAAPQCVDLAGSVVVTLSNTGNAAAPFSVKHPITGVTTAVSLAAGGTTNITLSNVPNGTYTVEVRSGDTNLDQQVTVNCTTPAVPSVRVTQSCTEVGGLVTLELRNTGGTSVTFTVGDSDYPVAPGGSTTVNRTYAVDGTYTIAISANGVDLSQTVTVACQTPGVPSASVKHTCVDGTSSVEITLSNTGGTEVTFTVSGVPYTVPAGSSTVVTITGLPDGTNTIPVSVGQTDLSQTVVINCVHPVTVTTICAETDVTGTPVLWWYTIKNDDTVSTTYTVTQGSSSRNVTVAAGASSTQSSNSGASISLAVDGQTVASQVLNTIDICTTEVEFKKVVTGPAPTPGETYTIVVYRNVGGTPTKALEFTIVGGETKSFSLPSGLFDGISYTVSETGKGTAITSQVAPNAFTLLGQNGTKVTVTATNGYAETSDGGSTTTTAPATTTTIVASEGPTTTTTVVGSQGPTTTVSRVLPRTGGTPNDTLGIALAMLLAGVAVLFAARRTRDA